MFGKVTFVAVLMILSAMVFASLKGPRVADFVTNGSENSSNMLRPSRTERMRGNSAGVAALGDSSAAGAGAMPMAAQPAHAPYAHPAPVAVAPPPQAAEPDDSSDQQQMNNDDSNDDDSNDNDNNDSSDDRNSNDDNDNSGDQAMNNQGPDEQSNNPFSQPVPPGMFRTPNGQLMPQINPPAIAPFPPRITNN
jgi:hypothetical protein